MLSKKLFDIIEESEVIHALGKSNPSITSLAFDSRKVEENGLFFAIRGVEADGHDYIDKALKKGAIAIVCEDLPDELSLEHTYVQLKDSRSALAKASNLFYDSPSEKLKLVGVTGTNGKTTVCTLLHQLFEKMDLNSGLISTVKYSYPGHEEDASHTTPDPIKLNSLLYSMVEAQCSYAFMEVSSHALDQKRIEGLNFTGAVFTNLTHDHLDYHSSFDNYLKSKKSFFDHLGKEAFALYNSDDKNGKVMVQNCKAEKIAYSLHSLSEVKGKILNNTIEGLELQINDELIHTRMVGKYNAYNLLAAYGVASKLGIEKPEILVGLTLLKGAEGRFELVIGDVKKVYGIVDYAHTPDALENILSTLKELQTVQSKIITVVGCGGNRDKEKRPKMALIAAVLSDQVVLTSDNPRYEDPSEILDHMMEGVKDMQEKVLVIEDRKQAIKAAVTLAQDGDIILIAGKGHEKYQEINGVKKPFDDLLELKTILG